MKLFYGIVGLLGVVIGVCFLNMPESFITPSYLITEGFYEFTGFFLIVGGIGFVFVSLFCLEGSPKKEKKQ